MHPSQIYLRGIQRDAGSVNTALLLAIPAPRPLRVQFRRSCTHGQKTMHVFRVTWNA